jgi:hypothetical protein
MAKIHLQDQRLFINAGMRFPACYAKAELLDTDKSRLPSTSDPKRVTCGKCQRLAKRRK